MHDQPPAPQPSLALRLALGCAGGAVVVALACLASVAVVAVQPGAQTLVFQPIFVNVGNFGLSLGVSGNADCPPAVVDCRVPPLPNRYYLGVWFSVTTSGPTGVTASYKPLLRLRLR